MISREVTVGLGATVVLFVAATLTMLILYPPLAPIDEGAHVSYGYYLTELDPPTVFDPLEGGPYTYRENRTVYVANHPPLHHAVLGPVVRGVNAVSDPASAIRAGRLLSLGFGVVALLCVAGLASELVPSRPSVWLSTAAIAMLIPHVTSISAFAYNDSAGLAMSVASLWAGARVFRLGPSRRRVGLLAIAVALAGLARVSAVPFAIVAVALAGAGALRHRSTARARLRSLAITCGIPALAMALIAGPFYLRNLRLYDDVSGGDALYDMLDRRPRPLAGLLRFDFAAARYEGLWIDLTFRADTGPVRSIGSMSFVLLWAGVALGVVALVRRARVWWRGDERHELVALAGLVLVVLAVVAGFAVHVTSGGIAHSRYLVGALPVLALLVSVGLAQLPRRPATAALGVGLTSCLLGTALIADGVVDLYLDSWSNAWRSLGAPLNLLLALSFATMPVALAVLLRTDARLRDREACG